MRMRCLLLTLSAVPLLLPRPVVGAAPAPPERPAIVRVIQSDTGSVLLRNGSPYFIKGAGTTEHLDALPAAGGDSIRTWGADDIGGLLDRAHALGLTVTIGLWLGHQRHGFDYQDPELVARQFEDCRRSILRYKDHPALLIWAVGNEMEGSGEDPAVWRAVNDIARMAKEVDPSHPTMTVIAELGPVKVGNLHRFCPDIDIVGINTYGGINSVRERYVADGGSKPYIVTEFGPPGQWETEKTDWGAPKEMTSTRKAQWYLEGYRDAVQNQMDLCLGSYVFLWGHKQEATATWYGMFLPDGSRLGTVEAMTQAWGGPAPTNRCPLINEIVLSQSSALSTGAVIEASVEVSDPDGDELRVDWVLRREAAEYHTGGDAENALPEYPEAIVSSDTRAARVRIPASGGGYRLFAYAYDGHGNAAVANAPLHVEGKVLPLPPPVAKIPFVVYGEAQKGQPFIPSGYMGHHKAVRMDGRCKSAPHSDPHCLQVQYSATSEWGSVAWQSPPDDWGSKPGGYDLSAANALSFWARGATGREIVSFGVGILGPEAAYPDSARVSLKDVRLTSDWKRYQIPLAGKDLSRIKTGFLWTATGRGEPITFYLDDIEYVFDAGASIPEAPRDAAKPKFPLTLLADGLSDPPFIPAGYMGDADAILLDDVQFVAGTDAAAEQAPDTLMPEEPAAATAPAPTGPAKVQSFPFVVYDEAATPPPYIPSGYMGNIAALTADNAYPGQPHSGSQCMKIAYSLAEGWAGIVWQSPANDWGALPGGFDLTGAHGLSFWARGTTGKEIVSFGVGIIGTDQPYPDTARVSLDRVHLTPEWREYHIPLRGKDLSCIKSGFMFTLAAQGGPATFYLDDIRFVADEAPAAVPVPQADSRAERLTVSELMQVIVDLDGRLVRLSFKACSGIEQLDKTTYLARLSDGPSEVLAELPKEGYKWMKRIAEKEKGPEKTVWGLVDAGARRIKLLGRNRSSKTGEPVVYSW